MTTSLLLLATLALLSMQAPVVVRTQVNVPAELTFTAQHQHADPFNEVTLEAVFTDPKGDNRTVPAFWDGGQEWKVRYASPLGGLHKFRTICSDATDAGLNGLQGQIQISPYRGKTPSTNTAR